MFKDARGREGLLDGGCRALGAVWGLPQPERPTPVPCDRPEGAGGREVAARFGGSEQELRVLS